VSREDAFSGHALRDFGPGISADEVSLPQWEIIATWQFGSEATSWFLPSTMRHDSSHHRSDSISLDNSNVPHRRSQSTSPKDPGGGGKVIRRAFCESRGALRMK